MRNKVPLFCSSGHLGYSSEVSRDSRHIVARKLARQVHVRFATAACTVESNEGIVHARPGDAIITATAGERWRVSRARFMERYSPVPPTPAGESGTYLSQGKQVLAIQMPETFGVQLADGISVLSGTPGDWLVDYGDGSLGIVSEAIFNDTYQILG